MTSVVLPTFADASVQEELQCAICFDVMQHPSSLACGHSFCTGCVQTLRPDEASKIKCPTCRKQMRKDFVVNENKVLEHVCSLAREAQKHACAEHDGKPMAYYCRTCDTRCCDACAILGQHRGHDVDSLAAVNQATRDALSEQLQQVQAGIVGITAHAKRQTNVFCGLATLVDDAADEVIDAVDRLRQRAKRALADKAARDDESLDKRCAAMGVLQSDIELLLTKLPHRDGLSALLADFERTEAALARVDDTAAKQDAQHAHAYLHAQPAFRELLAARQVLAQSSVGCDPAVQVFVQTAKSGFPQTLHVKLSWTLAELTEALFAKARVGEKRPMTANFSLCIYRQGKALGEGTTLGQQGVDKGCVLDVRFRVNNQLDADDLPAKKAKLKA